MSSGYELTPEAEFDLEEVYFYAYHRFGQDVAERVWSAYIRTFERIAEHPESGQGRPSLWPAPYKFIAVGPGLVAYRGDVMPVQIVRIARASRDWPRLP